MKLQFLEIVIFETSMFCKFSSSIIFAANLTLNHNHRTTFFDVFSQFSSSKGLKLLQIANITSIFQTLIVLSMLLQFTNRFPNGWNISVTFVWKFTIINTVANNRIDFLKEISSDFATRASNLWTCYLISWTWWSSLLLLLLIRHHSHSLCSSRAWWSC